jgi:hypothetical protein
MGPDLEVFKAGFFDDCVHLVESLPGLAHPTASIPVSSTIELNSAYVDSAFEFSHPTISRVSGLFMIKLTIRGDTEHQALEAGVGLNFTYLSPCVTIVTFGSFSHKCMFPFPVQYGLNVPALIARQAGWIEFTMPLVAAPSAGPYSKLYFPLLPFNNTITTWNLPYLNFHQLPQIDPKIPQTWQEEHLSNMFSNAEVALQEGDSPHEDNELRFKENLSLIFSKFAESNQESFVYGLYAKKFGEPNSDSQLRLVIMMNGLFLDYHSHSIVGDACVLPLTENLRRRLRKKLDAANAHIQAFEVHAEVIRRWRLSLPGMAERCRDWNHQTSYEYAQGIPVSVAEDKSPLCSCGLGIVGPRLYRAKMIPLFGYCTRVAIAPFFPVPWLEPSPGEFRGVRCQCCSKAWAQERCRWCPEVVYCDEECQQQDW